MTRWMYIFVVIVSCMAVGCRKESVPDESSTPENASTPDNASKIETRVPVHKAEVYVAMSGPSGKSSMTSWLVYSSKTTEHSHNEEGVSVETKEWETEQSTASFSMEDGRTCTIVPTFMKHDAGSDIWRLELQYGDKSETKQANTKSVIVSFDGHTAVTAFEDAHHVITIRPRTIKPKNTVGDLP